jgi:hypothetical protein
MMIQKHKTHFTLLKLLPICFGFIIALGVSLVADNAEAAYKVQQGRVEITSAQQDITITAVSATNKAFVLFSYGTGFQNSHTDENQVMVRGELLNTTTIRVYRGSATNSSWISWQVIECTDNEFTAYRGNGSFTAGNGDTSASIGATVTPADCMAFVTADNNQTGRQDYVASQLTAYVNASTTVRIQRAYTTAATANYNWVVVEWDTDKILSLQTGETTVTTHTEASRVTAAINTVHTDASILLYQYRPDTNGIAYAVAGSLDSSTQISFYKNPNYSCNIYVRWYVINFGADAVAQRGQVDYSSTSAWATHNETLSPAVTLNNTIAFSMHSCYGSTAGRAYPRPYGTTLLTSTTNLRIQRMRSGQPGHIEWQVLQLPGPTIVDLVSFDAIGRSGEVVVKWTTDSEIENAGFNIYRSENFDGPYTKINDSLIPGLGNSVMGKSYEYLDADVVDGITYYYKLEDVEYNGSATQHGPVISHPGIDTDNDGMSDDWENFYGLDSEDPLDAPLDLDNDSFTNLQEYGASTDPTQNNSAPPASTGGITILSSTDSGMVLELDTDSFETETMTVGGEDYQIIRLPYPHGQTEQEGKPQIPVKGMLLNVPFDSNITVTATAQDEEVLVGYNLYPVPGLTVEKDEFGGLSDLEVSESFIKDEEAYLQNSFYIGELASIESVGVMRGQDVSKLNIYPVQFNPVTSELKVCKKIHVVIDYGIQAPSVPQGEEDPFEELFQGTFSNYYKSRRWERRIKDKLVQQFELAGLAAYKVGVQEEGMHRISAQDLTGAGIAPNEIDPELISMYYRGKEIRIDVIGGDDGVFDPQDYIEFYGKVLDSRYSATNVYWLTFEGDPGLRMKTRPAYAAGIIPTKFMSKVHEETDELYWMDIPDVGYVDDHWFYFDMIWAPDVLDFPIELSSLSQEAQDATLTVCLQGVSYGFDQTDHHVAVSVNGNPVSDQLWDGNQEYIFDANVPYDYLVDGANIITLDAPGDTGVEFDSILVNWFEMSYPRKFTANNNELKFTHESEAGLVAYEASGFATDDVYAYIVTKAKKPKHIGLVDVVLDGSTYKATFHDNFTKSNTKDYLVLEASAFKSPISVEQDQSSDLFNPQNQADYIIITHEDFYSAVGSLAAHRTAQGLNVVTVNIQDIYDEFNGGIFSPEAIKTFLQYAYSEWQNPKPAYVLFVGDGTYDYQDLEWWDVKNYVPTHMVHSLNFGETGSDNWFVCLDGEDDILPDMFVGRLPVYDVAQAQEMVNKIISYETAPLGDWRKDVTLIADNIDGIFVDIAESLTNYLPPDVVPNKIYLDDYASPAVCKTDIISALNNGALITNYTGHSSVVRWAHENIFEIANIASLTNIDRLSFIPMMTCGSGYFVFPSGIFNCLAEEMLFATNGGAVATLAPGGISYPGIQQFLNQGLFESIFVEGNYVIGPSTTQAKLKVFENAGIGGRNVIESFNLLGDPALELRQ